MHSNRDHRVHFAKDPAAASTSAAAGTSARSRRRARRRAKAEESSETGGCAWTAGDTEQFIVVIKEVGQYYGEKSRELAYADPY